MRLKDSLVPKDENFGVYFVWQLSCFTIDSLYLMFKLEDQVFDLLCHHVIFVVDGLLLASSKFNDSIALLCYNLLC